MKEPPEEVELTTSLNENNTCSVTPLKAEKSDDARPINGFELDSESAVGVATLDEQPAQNDIASQSDSSKMTTDNGETLDNGVHDEVLMKISRQDVTSDFEAIVSVEPSSNDVTPPSMLDEPNVSAEISLKYDVNSISDGSLSSSKYCNDFVHTKDVHQSSTEVRVISSSYGCSDAEDNNVSLGVIVDAFSFSATDDCLETDVDAATLTIKPELPDHTEHGGILDNNHLVPLESMLTLGDRIKMTERSRFGRLRKKRCLSPSLVSSYTSGSPAVKRIRRIVTASRSPAKRIRKPTASKSITAALLSEAVAVNHTTTKLTVKLNVSTAAKSTSKPSTPKASGPPAVTPKRKRKRKLPLQQEQQPPVVTNSTAMSDLDATVESVAMGDGCLSEDVAIETEATTINAEVQRSPNPIKLKWLQGDVVWYKVQGQPWWPAKVASDPVTGFCTKMKVNFHTMYYLTPFGERDAPEWVSSCQILTFRGREKFLQYVASTLDRFPVDSHFYMRTHTKFHVAENKRGAWEAAIMEADVACKVAAAMEESLENMASEPGTPLSARKRKSIKLSRHEVRLFAPAKEKQNGEADHPPSPPSPSPSLPPPPPPSSKKKSNRKMKKVSKSLETEFDNAKPSSKESKAGSSSCLMPKAIREKAATLGKHIKKLEPAPATQLANAKIKQAKKAKTAMVAAAKNVRTKALNTITARKKGAPLTEIIAPPPQPTRQLPTTKSTIKSRDEAVLSLIFTPPKERIRIRRRKVAPPTENSVAVEDSKVAVTAPRRRNLNPSAKKRLQLADETGGVELAALLDRGSPRGKSAAAFQKNVDSILLQGASSLATALTGDRKRRTKSPAVKAVLPESGQNSGGDSDSATESSMLTKKDSVAEGKNDKFCLVCEKAISSSMVPLRCEGVCQGLVHDFCAKPSSTATPSEGYKCEECVTGVHSCFVCKKKSGEQETRKCGIYRCGKFYHDACISAFRSAKMEGKSITCSLHSCLSCTLRNNRPRAGRGRLSRCLRCPTAFHNSESCLPAGSSVLSGSTIICPVHYKPKKSSKNLHINVNWCFVCSTGGSLICCESCPASFHAECLNIVPPEGSYYCAECTAGTQPKYGDIVWVKLGVYRWWPAKICSPRSVPPNIQNLPHILGEFPVHFFGTKDYYWTSRSRVFQFLEGDQSAQDSSSNRLGKVFQKALQDALQAYHEWKQARETREAQYNERDSWKLPAYKHIKVNKPVGKATVPTVDPSQMTPCECDPNSENPCGSDSECLNRMLMFECHPDLCLAGSRCQNRRFETQQYCSAEPFKAEGKGWGLKSLVEIKKGDFVNEYVGEIIDEEECRRRMLRMHEENNTSYYFLTIDKDRIIDAARKGNLSRFMNHSCQPNCETHKWTVNGEKRVGLFAVRHIPIGTELTFNYNLDCLGNEKTTCKCGAPNCSGFIGERPKNNLVKSKKADKVVAGKKKRRKSRKIKLEVTEHDDECFRCGQDGELLMCDRKNCTKTYHLSCLDLAKPPHGRWECPWHHCDICGRRASALCFVCPNSYCKSHSVGNTHKMLDGNVCCRDHVDEDANVVQGIDAAVINWLNAERSNKVAVSGSAVRRKAEELATAANVSGFVADVGWLRRFRVRNAFAWQPSGGQVHWGDEASDEEQQQPPLPLEQSPHPLVSADTAAGSSRLTENNNDDDDDDDLDMGEGGVTSCMETLSDFITAGGESVPADVQRSMRRLRAFVASLFPRNSGEPRGDSSLADL